MAHNEMNDSTTGTLLSLGKTEFDRRMKKKYVKKLKHKKISKFRIFKIILDKNYLKMLYKIIVHFQLGMVQLLWLGLKFVFN